MTQTIERLALAAFLLACSVPASAQGTPHERVAVDAGVSLQTASTTFTQTVTFEAYSETGSLTTSYSNAQHARFDAGGVVRVWGGFGVGVSGTSMSGTDPAQIAGEIPHPINANSPRALSGSADAFHRESAVHVQAVYWFQPAPRIDLLVGGGPSFMHMEQDFVSDVAYSQSFPYDTVTFQSATITREQQSATGFNAGARVGVRLVSHVGVGGLVRYSRATLTFADAGASSVKLGGLEVGGGLHLTF
jgi:Outer membrane protein beta-barrel domain